MWLARPGEADSDAAVAPMVRSGPLVIDGRIAGAPPPRRRTGAFPLRYGAVAVAAILTLAAATAVVLAPGVAAGPEFAEVEARR